MHKWETAERAPEGRGSFFSEKSCGMLRAPASEAVGRKFCPLNRDAADGQAVWFGWYRNFCFVGGHVRSKDARRATLARVDPARTHEPRARDIRRSVGKAQRASSRVEGVVDGSKRTSTRGKVLKTSLRSGHSDMSGVKRPGEGEGPDGKRAYAGPSADFMDAEPELPEEYEDPDDDDVFLNDVMDQKVSARIDRSSVPFFFSNRGVAGFHPSRANTLHPTVSLTASSPRVPPATFTGQRRERRGEGALEAQARADPRRLQGQPLLPAA